MSEETKQPEPPKQLQPLTKDFLECFATMGGLVQKCGCGRWHVATFDAYRFDEGELERYNEKAKQEPGKWFFHQYSDLAFGSLGDQDFVMDCECLQDRFGKTAYSIWSCRSELLRFYKVRYEKLVALNERLKTEFGAVPQSEIKLAK